MLQQTNRNYKLTASLICGNLISLEKDIDALQKGRIDYLHFDVMDGIFVPRYGLFPEMITQIRTVSALPIDLHMMVEDAEMYLKTFIDAGLNKPNDIFVVHVESTRHLDRVLRKIKSFGIKSGVAINPATPLSVLDYVLDITDVVTLMAINPGIVGHKLIPGIMKKIAQLKRKLVNNPDILIEIDGGVNFESAGEMIQSGADMLVCGTQTIFKQTKPIDVKIKELRSVIDKHII